MILLRLNRIENKRLMSSDALYNKNIILLMDIGVIFWIVNYIWMAYKCTVIDYVQLLF